MYNISRLGPVHVLEVHLHNAYYIFKNNLAQINVWNFFKLYFLKKKDPKFCFLSLKKPQHFFFSTGPHLQLRRAWLRQAAVVVITKLGVGRCTTRTRRSSLLVSVRNLPLRRNLYLRRGKLMLVAVVCVIRQHHWFGLGKWSLGVD